MLEGVCVFFFQAEDGIRDRLVTGVQTCALPISVEVARTTLADTEQELTRLKQGPDPLQRRDLEAAVELAKEWRTNKMLRNLEALLAVSSAEASLIISGNGDVIEPDDGLIGIGSGGMYALAAARALMDTKLSPRKIAEKSMKIAADICIYTNDKITYEELEY